MKISLRHLETALINIVGPFSSVSTPGKPSTVLSYFFTCRERNTKWVEAFFMYNISAKFILHTFVQYISKFEVPLYIVTDRRTQFESEFFQNFHNCFVFTDFTPMPTTLSLTTFLERFHRIFKSFLNASKNDYLISFPVVLFTMRYIPMIVDIRRFRLLQSSSFVSC